MALHSVLSELSLSIPSIVGIYCAWMGCASKGHCLLTTHLLEGMLHQVESPEAASSTRSEACECLASAFLLSGGVFPAIVFRQARPTSHSSERRCARHGARKPAEMQDSQTRARARKRRNNKTHDGWRQSLPRHRMCHPQHGADRTVCLRRGFAPRAEVLFCFSIFSLRQDQVTRSPQLVVKTPRHQHMRCGRLGCACVRAAVGWCLSFAIAASLHGIRRRRL